MKYVFVDTVNGGTPSNATPDTSTSKYHTSSSWPANGARWASLRSAIVDATIAALTDDVTIYCQGATDETLSNSITTTGLSCASLLIQGDFAAAAPDANAYLVKATNSSVQRIIQHNKAIVCTLRGLQISHLGSEVNFNYGVECALASATLNVDSCYILINATGTGTALGASVSSGATATLNLYNTIIDIKSTAAATTRGVSRSNGTWNAYNCTIHGPGSTGTGLFSASGCTTKNCAVFDWTDDFNGSTISYCASDDGDGTNAQSGATWTNEFEDHANGDFRVKSGSTKLKDLGATDPGSGLFSDDIVGTARPQGSAWDIGAHEYYAPTSLTDVDTDETITTGQASVAYTGAGLTDATAMYIKTGTKEVACTSFVATNATSGTFTAPTFAACRTAGIKFGPVTFEIRNGVTVLATLAGTLNLETGWSAHTVSDISQAADTGCIYNGQSPAIAIPDQFAHQSTGVTIDSQGFVVLDGVTQFDYYIWDATDETWGTVGSFSTWPEVAADSTLTDAILTVTGGPTVNDGLMSWFAANGGSGTTLNELELSYLDSKGFSTGNRQDDWVAYTGSLGYSGSLMDRLRQFWISGG